MRFKNSRGFSFICVYILVFGTVCCGRLPGLEHNSEAYNSDAFQVTDEKERYVEKRIMAVCSEDLFCARDAYDSCHCLMIPMRWAFAKNKIEVIKTFNSLFDRFIQDEVIGANGEFDRFPWLMKNHWNYLMTEYLCLCVENEKEYSLDVLAYLINEYTYVFFNDYHGNWIAYAPYETFYELLDGIMQGDGYSLDNSQKHAITDNDLFSLAILCDLNYVTSQDHRIELNNDQRQILQASQKYTEKILEYGVVWNERAGGWLFQPGVWDDNGANAYTGYRSLAEVNPEIPIVEPDLAWDTSHFQRFPCFLISFQRNSFYSQVIEKYKTGLAEQLMQFVIKGPNQDGLYLLTNFMDGHNGVYSYNPEKRTGVDAYQASLSLLFGWWSLLSDKRINDVYVRTQELLENVDTIPDIYDDSLTTRERNPDMVSMDWYKIIQFCVVDLNTESE